MTTPIPSDPPLLDAPVGNRLIRWVGVGLLAVLIIGYLAHVRSPLRLNTDAVTILVSAANYAAGKGLLIDGKPPVYPPLVLVTIAGADRLGLARPPLLAGAYLACVSVMLGAWYALIRRLLPMENRQIALWTILLCLLCGALIKHAIIPLTDIPYCAISAVVLYLLVRAEENGAAVKRRVILLVAAGILILVAVSVRTVGITLIPAWLLAAWHLAPKGFLTSRTSVEMRAVLAVVTLGVAVVAVVFITRTQYFHDLVHRYSGKGDGVSLMFTLRQRLIELGQLVTNLPASRIPAKLTPAVPLVGVIALAAFGFGRWVLRGRSSGSVGGLRLRSFDGMLLSYAVIMAFWPYPADTRFWLPVLPLFAFYSLMAGFELVKRVGALRFPLLLWGMGYAALGVVALATSLKFTLSRHHFVNGYGTAEVRAAYRIAWNLPGDSSAEPPSANWVETIRHYDP